MKRFIIQEISTPKGIGPRFDLYQNEPKLGSVMAKFIRLILARDILLPYSESDEDKVVYYYLDNSTMCHSVGHIRKSKEVIAIG